MGTTTLVAQAEALFETYLAARLVRARRNLTHAKVALLREPRNRVRLEELRRAEAETERLQAQLLDQVRRAGEARERAVAGTARATEDFRAAQTMKAEEAYRATAASRHDAAKKPLATKALTPDSDIMTSRTAIKTTE